MSDDPAFAPIEGVDLDGYTKATAAIAKAGVSSAEDAAKVAEGTGVPAGKWPAVSNGWITRMRESEAVRTEFGTRYGQY